MNRQADALAGPPPGPSAERASPSAARLRRVLRSRAVVNTGWAGGAEVLRMVTSLGSFLLITRLLTKSDYGVYVGTLGLAWFCAPWATLGAPFLLLQRVAARRTRLLVAYAGALSTVALGTVVCTVALVVGQRWIVPQAPVSAVAALALAEIGFMTVQDVCILGCQATEALKQSIVIRAPLGVLRFVVLAALVGSGVHVTLATWSWVHLATTIPPALWALWVTGARSGLVRQLQLPRREDVVEGVPFAIGFGTDKVRESADATLLLRFDQPLQAATYGAATRLVDIAVVPLRAMLHASNAQIFRAGAASARAARTIAARATGVALAYASVAAVLIATAGPYAIRLLPGDYRSTETAIRLLAFWPMTLSTELFAGTAVTAIGRQRARVSSTVATTGLNIALNVWLIPAHGWRASVAAILVASAANGAILWTVLLRAARREGKPGGVQPLIAAPPA